MDLQQRYALVQEPLELTLLFALVNLYLSTRSLRRAVRARAYFRRGDLIFPRGTISGAMARTGA